MRNVSTYRMGKTLAHGRCSVNICQSYIGIILIHGPDSEMCSTFHAESDKHSAWPTIGTQILVKNKKSITSKF